MTMGPVRVTDEKKNTIFRTSCQIGFPGPIVTTAHMLSAVIVN